ncbi:hypothetical protein PHMEG_00027216 [Phytophthora megakarya]|uniref:Peptidase A2 domain-containing protein n=1 Tax=Phytophthora megakarya TaxID=4795 RepID=A0A225V7X4_9STRA|nr:hypothetical protein PHMEG_00027216 [Phytophthora megakarya]
MVRSDSTYQAVIRTSREDVKLGRSPGWNPVLAERSRYSIYAYVNKVTADRRRKESELRGNTCNLHSYTAEIASLPQISEFSRSNAEVALDLKEESPGIIGNVIPRGNATISGRINQEKVILLLDTGAEVSILDTTFARKVGCNFDTSQRQECVRIGEYVYTTEGRTKINTTLAGYLVYFFDNWIEDLSGQNAILGMDFMVPAGVRMDFADGSMRLPDEVGIPLNGRKRLHGEKARSVMLERSLRIPVGQSEESAARIKWSATEKLWVTRGERWVPTVTEGPGRIRYRVLSNIAEEILRLDHRLNGGMILDQDKVPRFPEFVSVGSRRYREWQNLALESTIGPPELIEDLADPAVQRPSAGIADATQIEAESPDPERGRPSTPTTSPDADRYLSRDAEGGGISESMPDQATDRTDIKDIKTENRTGIKDIEPKTENHIQI